MTAEHNGVGAVRRVVTGVNGGGRSYVVSDGLAPNTFRSPDVDGFGAAVAWFTTPGPVSNEGADDAAAADAEIPMYPALGGTIFRIADFPPDSAYGQQGRDGLFSSIGDGAAARDGATHSGDGTSGSTRQTRSISPSSWKAKSGCYSTMTSACCGPGTLSCSAALRTRGLTGRTGAAGSRSCFSARSRWPHQRTSSRYGRRDGPRR